MPPPKSVTSKSGASSPVTHTHVPSVDPAEAASLLKGLLQRSDMAELKSFVTHRNSQLDAKIAEVQASLGPLAKLGGGSGIHSPARSVSALETVAAATAVARSASPGKVGGGGGVGGGAKDGLSRSATPSTPTTIENDHQHAISSNPLASFLLQPPAEVLQSAVSRSASPQSRLNDAGAVDGSGLSTTNGGEDKIDAVAAMVARALAALIARIVKEAAPVVTSDLARVFADLAPEGLTTTTTTMGTLSASALRDGLSLRGCDVSAAEAATLVTAFPASALDNAAPRGHASVSALLDAVESARIAAIAADINNSNNININTTDTATPAVAILPSQVSEKKIEDEVKIPSATAGLELPRLSTALKPSPLVHHSGPSSRRGSASSLPRSSQPLAPPSASVSPAATPTPAGAYKVPSAKIDPSVTARAAAVAKTAAANAAADAEIGARDKAARRAKETASKEAKLAPTIGRHEAGGSARGPSPPAWLATSFTQPEAVKIPVVVAAPVAFRPPVSSSSGAGAVSVGSKVNLFSGGKTTPTASSRTHTPLPKITTSMSPPSSLSAAASPAPPQLESSSSFSQNQRNASPTSPSPVLQNDPLMLTQRISSSTVPSAREIELAAALVAAEALRGAAESRVAALTNELEAVNETFFEQLEDLKYELKTRAAADVSPSKVEGEVVLLDSLLPVSAPQTAPVVITRGRSPPRSDLLAPITSPTVAVVATRSRSQSPTRSPSHSRAWDHSPAKSPPRNMSAPSVPRERRSVSPRRTTTTTATATVTASPPRLIQSSPTEAALLDDLRNRGVLEDAAAAAAAALASMPVRAHQRRSDSPLSLMRGTGGGGEGEDGRRSVAASVGYEDLAVLRTAWDAAAAAVPVRAFSVGPPGSGLGSHSRSGSALSAVPGGGTAAAAAESTAQRASPMTWMPAAPAPAAPLLSAPPAPAATVFTSTPATGPRAGPILSRPSSPTGPSGSPTSGRLSTTFNTAARRSPKEIAVDALAAAASSVVAADAAIAAAQSALEHERARRMAAVTPPPLQEIILQIAADPSGVDDIESAAARLDTAGGRMTPPASPPLPLIPAPVSEEGENDMWPQPGTPSNLSVAGKSAPLSARSTATVKQPAPPARRAVAAGAPRTAESAFPFATDVEYALRAEIRRALWRKAAAAGVGVGIAGSSPRNSTVRTVATPGPAPDAPSFLLATLDGVLVATLERVFSRYLTPAPKGGPPMSTNRVKDMLRASVTPTDFAAGVSVLLAEPLALDDIYSLVKNLRLDVLGKVSQKSFVEFISLPLTIDNVKNESVDENGNGNGNTDGGRTTSSLPPLALTSAQQQQQPVHIVYSTLGAPRPITAPLSPAKRPHGVPPVNVIQARSTNYKHAAPRGPLGGTRSAWELAGVNVPGRPRITVPWPTDLTDSASPFWIGVAALERALMKEVKKRAKVHGVAPVESIAVLTAGARAKAQPPTSREAASLLGSTTDTTGVYTAQDNLRRSFLFFDRRGVREVTVDDLHALCSELGLVNAPAPAARPAGYTLTDNDSVESASSSSSQPLSLPPSEAELVGLTSPSRLGAGRSLLVGLRVPDRESFAARSAADSAALHDAWMDLAAGTESGAGDLNATTGTAPATITESSSAASLLSTTTLPFGLPAPPTWDPLAADMSGGARALVMAVFRRLCGKTDPGVTKLSLRTFSLAFDADAFFNFSQFSHWASPLSFHLNRVREQVQSAFLASAYTGSGNRDFEKAFRKIDLNGDGVLSTVEFLAAIGPIARYLSPMEVTALVEHFDLDGTGTIDYREFLSLFNTTPALEKGKEEEEKRIRDETKPQVVNGEWINLLPAAGSE